MNSMVDTTAALAPAAARFERQAAGARQQRWLAELEQAMLAQRGGGQRPAQAQHGGDDKRPAQAQPAVTSVAAAAPKSATAAAGGTQAQPMSPTLSGARTAHADAAQVPSAALRTDAGGQQTAAVKAVAEAVRREAPVVGPQIAPAAVVTPNAPSRAPQTASGISPGFGDGAGVIDEAGNAQLSDAEPLSGSASRPIGLGMAPAAATQAMPDEAASEAGASDAAASTPDALDGETYDKNLMHLFYGEDGVQVWIRDAQLTQAPAGVVAQAMTAEMRAAGTKLVALTINGRRVATPVAAQDEEGGGEPAMNAAAQPPQTKGNI
jgi:hypothetical protein